jgi:hypothetical protein
MYVADEREFGVSRKPGREGLLKRLRAFRGRLPADFAGGQLPYGAVSHKPTSSGGGRPCSPRFVSMAAANGCRQLGIGHRDLVDHPDRAGGGRLRWIGAGSRDGARRRRCCAARLAHSLADHSAEPRARHRNGGRRSSQRAVRLALDLCRVGGARRRHVGWRMAGIAGDGSLQRHRGHGPYDRQVCSLRLYADSQRRAVHVGGRLLPGNPALSAASVLAGILLGQYFFLRAARPRSGAGA